MSLLKKDKSLQKFALQQLITDDFNLNSSSSASLLNPLPSNNNLSINNLNNSNICNISASFNSNKLFTLNQNITNKKNYQYHPHK